MIHTFLVELTDEVKGYEEWLDRLEMACGCEEFDMTEHDKQIRAEVIDEIIKYFEEHHIFVFDKNEIVDELEQLKEQNK